MSSGPQAVRDDRQEWDHFCKVNDCGQNWSLYSREYDHALAIHAVHGYRGRELRLAVAHAIQREDLFKQQATEWQELQHMLKLLEKYDTL